MKTERIEFTGHDGSTLAARLDLPTGKPSAYALFVHCFTCSKDIPAARRISQRLASLGIAVFRFDFTGLGHSEGEFANTNFSSNIEDILLAAKYMREQFQAPELLIGHSLGGAAILSVAGKILESKAVITIGAPADPHHLNHLFNQQAETIKADGQAEVQLGGRTFTIKQDFIDDISNNNLSTKISSLKKALLVLHAPMDDIVEIDNASKIFQLAKHPKSFITLDDTDHLLSRPKDADYAAELIATWAQRYVNVSLLPKSMSAPDGVVRVSESDSNSFTQDISASGHHLIADEPESYGGNFLGATPYQLVSAGLGACTSMTIRMYARRKKIPLDHVEVDISHNKIHATDCDTCDSSSGKIDQFERKITLLGDIKDKDRKRLLEIADRCPVHRTLESEINIVTSIND